MVENEILDIAKFETWIKNYINGSPLILLEKGKFICEVEVEKMSKSKFNVVNPDDMVSNYGADSFRLYEMFLGPIEDHKPWNTQGIDGVYRFVKKLWRLIENGISEEEPSKEEFKILHKTIKKVSEDIERLSFNTCVSAFMICVNELTEKKCNKKAIFTDLAVVLAPFAPHLAEELWQKHLGQAGSVTEAPYPVANDSYLIESTFAYPINIGKKVRTKIELDLNLSQEQVQEAVLADEIVQKWVEDKPIRKFIFVKGRIVNIVV